MFHKLTDHVYYEDFEEFADRPVIGYICGDRYSALVDAGNSARHINKVLKHIEETGLRKPDMVFLTHSHWDHTYGLHALNIPSFANSVTYKYLREDLKLVWNDEEFRKNAESGRLMPFIAEHMADEYNNLSEVKVVLPTIVYEKKLTVDLGGVIVELLKLDNPHSDDGSVVLVPGEAVFLGDAAGLELAGADWVDHPDKVVMFHDALAELDFREAVVSHFEHSSKEELLRDLKSRFPKEV